MSWYILWRSLEQPVLGMKKLGTAVKGYASLDKRPLPNIADVSFMPVVLAVADSLRQPLYEGLSLQRAVLACCTHQQAGQVISERRPLVAVLDCADDADFGLVFARKIKTEAAEMPLIFVTEVSSEEIVTEAFRIGVRDFLKKPFEISRLSESIEYLINIRGASQEKRNPFFLNKSDEREDIARVHTVPKNLLNVVRFIESDLSSDFSLELLAKKAFVSKFHFCKVFKRHFGTTPLKFVNHKRIGRARELLLRSDFNVTQTAIEVGFQDSSSFAKHFKKMTGFTPMEYRSFYSQLGDGMPQGVTPLDDLRSA
jgi:AraC family transcriptional regulator